MERKKLENRFADWAKKFGFMLPDGSFPQPSLFAVLVSTRNRCHLWETILERIESRERVKTLRKKILVFKLKSEKTISQGTNLPPSNAGVEYKLALWQRKETLESVLSEKCKEINALYTDVYVKAETIQYEVCKLAEIEKQILDLKEKLLVSKLLLLKMKMDEKNIRNQLKVIKSFGIFNSLEQSKHDFMLEKIKNVHIAMQEDLGANNNLDLNDEKEIHRDVVQLIFNKNAEDRALNLLLEMKKENWKEFSRFLHTCQCEEKCEGSENMQKDISIKWLEKRFKLNIIENSVEAIYNRIHEKEKNIKLKDIMTRIEKYMFNKSDFYSSGNDISYLCPSETGDSLTGRNEKMSELSNALNYFGLRRRRDFLKCEVERISEENKKNFHWTTEKEKFEEEMRRSAEKLGSLKDEIMELIKLHDTSTKSVISKHIQLESTVNEINENFALKNFFHEMNNFTKELLKGIEAQIEKTVEIPLFGFKKIKIAPCREVYEFELLPNCLDNYGGELKELFGSILISPFQKPESILERLEDRTSLLCYINQNITENEKEIRESCLKVASGQEMVRNKDLLENKYKEVSVILSKVLLRKGDFNLMVELIKKILKNWLGQPYRLMIPDALTISGMTLRQFEEKFRTACNEIKYFNDFSRNIVNK